MLVLDEPTAQLDVRGEAAFYDRFLELTAGVTTIVISHRFASVRRADRIAVLDGGRFTELGTHDELLATGGVYAEMFNAQASGSRRRSDPLGARKVRCPVFGNGFRAAPLTATACLLPACSEPCERELHDRAIA